MRVAIVGSKFMGTTHAQIYSALPGADLVAMVSPNVGGAVANLAKINLALPVYPSLSELLAAESVDVVDICAPTDVHANLALEAIAAGKHVFCEKPLALTLADVDAIGSAARAAGVIVQVGQCIRFWPEYQALAKLAQTGTAGRLVGLTMDRRCARPAGGSGNWLNIPERSGGAALDLHIHDTDFVLSLLGIPEAVTSVGHKDEFGWSQIHTIYHFAGRSIAAGGGWNSPDQWEFKMSFQAVFEKATVEYDCRRNPTLTITEAGEPTRPLPYEAAFEAQSASGLGNISALGGYYNLLADFTKNLRMNRQPEAANLDQSRDALRVVLAEIESASAGRTISFV